MTSANSTIFAAIHDGCGSFYSDFEDKLLNFKAKSSAESYTAGFGVFGVNNSIYGGSVEAHVNKHYSIYADQLSGDYNLNWKGGSGCNEGVGQLAVAKKDTVGATDEYKWTGSLSASTIKSNYWSTPLANLKFYSWGSSVADISLKNSDGTLKKANTASTSSEALRRLVGASTDSWTNSPTLAEKNANDYILVETSSNVVEFVNSYNLSALLGKDSTITTDSKFNLKNLPNLDVTVGSTGLSLPSSTKVNLLYQNQTGFKYNARLDFSDDNDSAANTHLADVAQSLVTNTFLTDRGGVGITSAFNSCSTSELSSSEVTNIWGNTNGYATAGFKTSNYDWTNRSTVDMINNKIGLANKYSYVGLTLDYFVQDVKVKSSKKSLTRGEDGAISKGSTINSTEYSIFSNGYHILNNAKLGASGVTYVVSFPNSKANSSYSLIDADGAQNFSNLIFTDDVSYNNVEGLSNLKAVINSKISEATVIPVGNEDTFDFYVGAFQDVGKSTSNSFVGYSVYLVEDNMVTPNQDTSMQLKAYEANFVYPTLLGDTEGHIIRTVGTGDLSKDSSFSDVWISKTQDYSGTAINRELVHTNMFDLLYSTAKIKVAEDTWLKQNFKAEATDPKKFTSVGTTGIWLNHQVNLSRGTFGENLVASSFSTKNRSTFSDDYITKTLGYSLGTKGAESPSGLAVGKTSLMSSGSDAFKWACNKAATITSNVFMDYGYTYTVSPFIGGENINDAGYDVSESSYRYITNSRNTGKGVSGQLDLQTSGNYSAMFSKTYDDVLNFYPEVDMIAYKYNAASAKLSATGADLAVTQERLAVLGEKQRSVNPTGVFSIRVVGDSHSLAGVTKSDTVATGSDAKKLSEKFGNLQVIYAGGNVNLSTESAYEINVSGFILDQIDINVDGKDENKIVSAMGADTAYNAIIADNSDLKNIWGNSSYNTADKYAAWIKSFKESLAVDVSLNTCKNADGSGVVKTYNGFKVSSSKATGGDIKAITSYALTYKGGTVVNDDAYKALIRAIATEYYGDASDSSISKAKTLFVNSGINKSILDSIESCKDSDNGSEVVEDIFGKNTKWYDEQVRTFVVRYYKCDPVKIGKVLVNDKIDINAGPSQDKKTQKLFQNGYVGQWNMTVYLSKAVTSLPDMVIYSPKNGNLDAAINSGSVLIAKQHVEGADFIISDATTSDARN